MQSIVKQLLCGEDSAYRPAYARSGWITLKAHFPVAIWSAVVPRHPLVRCSGHVVTKLQGENAEELASGVLAAAEPLQWQAMHVWEPDSEVPGSHGFEPGETPLVAAITATLRGRLAAKNDSRSDRINVPAASGEHVLDVIVEQPGVWWVGTHRVTETHDAWPGGVPPLPMPPTMISRAYRKIAEAVAWADLPLRPGQHAVEIGSAPGGACQYLLDCGLHVAGIDPADMDPAVAAHPKFQHIRGRAKDLKRRFYARYQWLFCDANVAPRYTLDTVEAIVTHSSNRCRGAVLTLKLAEPESALLLPEHLQRIASWGVGSVEARQLASNRREITVAIRSTAGSSRSADPEG